MGPHDYGLWTKYCPVSKYKPRMEGDFSIGKPRYAIYLKGHITPKVDSRHFWYKNGENTGSYTVRYFKPLISKGVDQ